MLYSVLNKSFLSSLHVHLGHSCWTWVSSWLSDASKRIDSGRNHSVFKGLLIIANVSLICRFNIRVRHSHKFLVLLERQMIFGLYMRWLHWRTVCSSILELTQSLLNTMESFVEVRVHAFKSRRLGFVHGSSLIQGWKHWFLSLNWWKHMTLNTWSNLKRLVLLLLLRSLKCLSTIQGGINTIVDGIFKSFFRNSAVVWLHWAIVLSKDLKLALRLVSNVVIRRRGSLVKLYGETTWALGILPNRHWSLCHRDVLTNCALRNISHNVYCTSFSNRNILLEACTTWDSAFHATNWLILLCICLSLSFL